tara:strand:+ start:209 stop:832 length:624 start_codon:yes stop_codon:yes gene_type:complete
MIVGLDISTSITGITVLSKNGEILLNEAWDMRKYKDFFQKADHINEQIKSFHKKIKLQTEQISKRRAVGMENSGPIPSAVPFMLDPYRQVDAIYIEQSLQSFRSGFSSAKTLSTLSRFNGIVSWMCYENFGIKPEYIAATSARKSCGIKVPKGVKAKQVVIKYVVDNVPDVSIEYTKHGNPKPQCYDMADSWVIARAGWLECQKMKK